MALLTTWRMLCNWVIGILMAACCVANGGGVSKMANILQRPMRSVSYPESSNMAMFLALAIPLEDPYNAVSFSYFFEADYTLPVNYSLHDDMRAASSETDASSSDRRRRSIDRSTVYAVLSNKFESAGFPGHECLLRSICEASEYPLEHNGVLGDVFRVIFTPSSSKEEDHLPKGVVEAELKGRNRACLDYRASCPLGLFDSIGVLL